MGTQHPSGRLDRRTASGPGGRLHRGTAGRADAAGPAPAPAADRGSAHDRGPGRARLGRRADRGRHRRRAGPGAAAARRPAGDPLPGGTAGEPAEGRDPRRRPRPSGRDRGRRDRLRQDHPAAQDLPGTGPRHPRDDRSYPAPAPGRPQRGRADRRGAGHPGGPGGRLYRPVRRPGGRDHPGQGDDRRHPAGRVAAGPPAARLRHTDHRRGARTQPQHRLHPRLPQAAAPAPARPESDHHVGHHRPAAVLGPLRRCTGAGGLRAGLPGRGALSLAGRGRPPRRRGRTAAPTRRARREQHSRAEAARRAGARPDPGDLRGGRRTDRGGARRHPGVPGRGAGDPGHRGRAVPDRAGRDRGAPAVRAAAVRRPAPDLRVAPRPPGGAGHEHRRDLPDRARHPVRRRSRHGEDLPVQQPNQGAAAADRADLTGIREPAGGPVRAARGRDLPAAVHRGRLRGTAPVHRSGDPADQPRLGDPADDRPGAGRGRRLPVHRPAGSPAGRRRRGAAHRTRRAGAPDGRIQPAAHPAGTAAGPPAGRPEARPDGARGGPAGVPAGGAGDHRGAVHPGPAGAAARRCWRPPPPCTPASRTRVRTSSPTSTCGGTCTSSGRRAPPAGSGGSAGPSTCTTSGCASGRTCTASCAGWPATWG